MAMVNASPFAFVTKSSTSFLPSISFSSIPLNSTRLPYSHVRCTSLGFPESAPLAAKRKIYEGIDMSEDTEDKAEEEVCSKEETLLYSFVPLPLLFVAALPGGKCSINANPSFLFSIYFYGKYWKFDIRIYFVGGAGDNLTHSSLRFLIHYSVNQFEGFMN